MSRTVVYDGWGILRSMKFCLKIQIFMSHIEKQQQQKNSGRVGVGECALNAA